MKIVMTGGHHSSALPVIKLLSQEHPDVLVYWFGHRKSLKNDKNDTLEYKEITSIGIPFYELKAGKVYKTFDLERLLKVPFGFIQAFYLLLKIKPHLVVSFGGYLAVPVVLVAKILGIPSITHEQTVVAGYANKVISKFSDKVMVSWKQSAALFPKEKVVYTGIPLRESITKISSDSFKTTNGLPYVYITAGKTGSLVINNVVKSALPKLLTFCNVIHQCGDYSQVDSFGDLSKEYEKIETSVDGKYFIRKFVLDNEIGEAFAKASLVICRAGAHTISELLFLNKPSLMIPIPWVSHNEQNLNAQYLVSQKLGEILEEKNLSADLLVEKVRNILTNLANYGRVDAKDYQDIKPESLIVNEIIKYKTD